MEVNSSIKYKLNILKKYFLIAQFKKIYNNNEVFMKR